MESKTQDEAAWQLGCSLSTLKRRLERGRELLRVRLSRRGVTLSAALCATLLTPLALPAALVATTSKVALLFLNDRARFRHTPPTRQRGPRWRVGLVCCRFAHGDLVARLRPRRSAISLQKHSTGITLLFVYILIGCRVAQP